ncbi:MAG: STAS-like domain-containing protein [Spirochaetales bacterium]|nr:STAS-like domain-containing protein [Spirochaetales bacterium]
MNIIKLSVYSITGDSFCIAAEDGEKVFLQLKKAMDEKMPIDLSFLNIEMLTSAFLNTAIGQMYDSFDENEIKSRLSVSDIKDEDKLLLKRVVDTAKAYYKNPSQFEESINKIIAS